MLLLLLVFRPTVVVYKIGLIIKIIILTNNNNTIGLGLIMIIIIIIIIIIIQLKQIILHIHFLFDIFQTKEISTNIAYCIKIQI